MHNDFTINGNGKRPADGGELPPAKRAKTSEPISSAIEPALENIKNAGEGLGDIASTYPADSQFEQRTIQQLGGGQQFLSGDFPFPVTQPLYQFSTKRLSPEEAVFDLELTLRQEKGDGQGMMIKVNKAYLGRVSDYFQRLFSVTHSWQESGQSKMELIIQNLQSFEGVLLTRENVYDVLRYCYTRSIFFRGIKECLAILSLAGRWQIESLMKICERYLIQSFNELIEAFEPDGLWGIIQETQGLKLQRHFLDWAAAQSLQIENQDIQQILTKEKEKVKKLTPFIPLREIESKRIQMNFSKIESLTFKGWGKNKAEEIANVLEKLSQLKKLKFVDMHLLPRFIDKIKELKLLESLSLIDCHYQCGWLGRSGLPSLRVFKSTNEESFNKSGFNFLEGSQNLESLVVRMKECARADFKKLNSLTKLRVLTLDIRRPGTFQDYYQTLQCFPLLEKLELNLGKEDGGDEGYYQWNGPYVEKILIDQQRNSCLKIFKSNVWGTTLSFLNAVSGLQAVTELSISTKIDSNQLNQENPPSFSLMPSLNILQWDCLSCKPILPFLASMINLQQLHLKNAKLDSEVISQMTKLTDLHILHFEGGENLDDASLAVLVENLTELESLTLTRCDFLTDKGLVPLLKSSTLQKVVIEDCPNIFEEGIIPLQQHQGFREFKFIPTEAEKNWEVSKKNDDRAQRIISRNPFHIQALSYTAKSKIEGVKNYLDYYSLGKAPIAE